MSFSMRLRADLSSMALLVSLTTPTRTPTVPRRRAPVAEDAHDPARERRRTPARDTAELARVRARRDPQPPARVRRDRRVLRDRPDLRADDLPGSADQPGDLRRH